MILSFLTSKPLIRIPWAHFVACIQIFISLLTRKSINCRILFHLRISLELLHLALSYHSKNVFSLWIRAPMLTPWVQWSFQLDQSIPFHLPHISLHLLLLPSQFLRLREGFRANLIILVANLVRTRNQIGLRFGPLLLQAICNYQTVQFVYEELWVECLTSMLKL